ncbi:unnamed protein product, partial [Mesorhabditis spiculigera]
MSGKSALVLLVDGTEEMEAVITMDILRRGDVKVTTAGLAGSGLINCARDTKITPDAAFADVKDKNFDMIVLPGGPGSSKYGECPEVGKLLHKYTDSDRFVAAICAAPDALRAHKISPGASVTAYPSVREGIEGAGYKFLEQDVVVDKKLITSRGPGTAFQFGLKLVEALQGKDKAQEVAKATLVDYH